MKSRWIALLLVLSAAAAPAFAQVRPANEMGVAAGHEHLRSMDVEGARKFWLALGGEPAALGMTQIIKFPGVYLMFQNAAGGNRGAAPATPPAPLQPSEGSTVESLGFKVKNLKDSLAKWEAAGIKPLPGATARQAFLMAPDNIRVQITEDPAIATAIATDELKMLVPNVNEAADWYAKFFGARVSRQNAGLAFAQIPGMNIRLVETKQPMAATQGRAIDHIGMEVRNLEPFMKKLEEAGVKINRPYAAAPAQLAPLKSLAFVTDPWGTYIELNEGFADIK